jgi:adenylate cyclase
MAESTPKRKLVAILAADVVGYSKMMGENEDRTLRNLKACRSLTDESIASYHGRIFGSAGDSVIAEFASPVDAVVAAVEFQRNLRERNEGVNPEDQMQFRVGLNLGDVIVEGDNLYGDGVNVAARLEASAAPGGISLSEKFHDEVCRKLDLNFVNMGAQEMKNISKPVSTFKVLLGHETEEEKQAAPAPSPTLPEEPYKPPAIAVLPFANMSNDPEQEYFADGITEDIITSLSLWKTFPVISRNSSFTYKGKSVNLKVVAGELGVRYIVEGSVRKGGNKVRITAQLIDATEDHHLWSERWDRSLDDIFEVQDEVSSSIAALVSPAVKGQEQERVIRKPTKNMNAWDEYLRGLAILNSNVNLEEAKAHGLKSIELDPMLSDSYILVCKCLAMDIYDPSKSSDRESNEAEVHEKARRAFELDPKNPEALSNLSFSYNIKRDFDQRLEMMKKALDINPSHAEVNHQYGRSLISFKEFEKAKEYILRAAELNPSQSYNGSLTYCHIGLRAYETAVESCNISLERYPSHVQSYGFKAAMLGHLDRLEEAQDCLIKYQEIRPFIKTLADYEKVAPTALKEVLLEGMAKAGMPTA